VKCVGFGVPAGWTFLPLLASLHFWGLGGGGMAIESVSENGAHVRWILLPSVIGQL
jgi:hypothetical protein